MTPAPTCSSTTPGLCSPAASGVVDKPVGVPGIAQYGECMKRRQYAAPESGNRTDRLTHHP